jgi:NADPH:quinone reductase-like Zn-dependent oxidoreductase
VRPRYFVARPERSCLDELARLLSEGDLQAIVAGVLPLARAEDAFSLAADHRPGKVVLGLASDLLAT